MRLRTETLLKTNHELQRTSIRNCHLESFTGIKAEQMRGDLGVWGFSWMTNRGKDDNISPSRFKADNGREGVDIGGEEGWGLRLSLLICGEEILAPVSQQHLHSR